MWSREGGKSFLEGYWGTHPPWDTVCTFDSHILYPRNTSPTATQAVSSLPSGSATTSAPSRSSTQRDGSRCTDSSPRSVPSLAGPSLSPAFWTHASSQPPRPGRRSNWARCIDAAPSLTAEDPGHRQPCLQRPVSFGPQSGLKSGCVPKCVWEVGGK